MPARENSGAHRTTSSLAPSGGAWPPHRTAAPFRPAARCRRLVASIARSSLRMRDSTPRNSGKAASNCATASAQVVSFDGCRRPLTAQKLIRVMWRPGFPGNGRNVTPGRQPRNRGGLPRPGRRPGPAEAEAAPEAAPVGALVKAAAAASG